MANILSYYNVTLFTTTETLYIPGHYGRQDNVLHWSLLTFYAVSYFHRNSRVINIKNKKQLNKFRDVPFFQHIRSLYKLNSAIFVKCKVFFHWAVYKPSLHEVVAPLWRHRLHSVSSVTSDIVIPFTHHCQKNKVWFGQIERLKLMLSR